MTEKTIIYLVPLADEAERYRPKLLRAYLKPTQYNENILNIKKLKREFKKDQKFLLNGNRLLDQILIRFCAECGKDINIIQPKVSEYLITSNYNLDDFNAILNNNIKKYDNIMIF